ncbi:MAG: hypothetical protein OEN00_11690, partial [Gemmatimonadota bacterium]|nr:hypothetical protein [Gemmatimonadota bacterium]
MTGTYQMQPESGPPLLLTQRVVLALMLLCFGGAVSVRAQLADSGPNVAAASGEAVCTQGVVSSIDVESRSIFDPGSTNIAPLAWTYRTLNLLHVNTTEAFVRRELLFQEGDCYDPFLVSESQRLLDGYGFLFVEDVRDEPNG